MSKCDVVEDSVLGVETRLQTAGNVVVVETKSSCGELKYSIDVGDASQ